MNAGCTVAIEISPGELIDRMTILEIKQSRMTEAAKLRNVTVELDRLSAACRRAIARSEEIDGLAAELRRVNESLWDVEDALRDCERRQEFGPLFIRLARSVYCLNDQRAALKRRINERLQSTLVEEKQYAAYSGWAPDPTAPLPGGPAAPGIAPAHPARAA